MRHGDFMNLKIIMSTLSDVLMEYDVHVYVYIVECSYMHEYLYLYFLKTLSNGHILI
jgi:hypothetical protein